MSITYDQAKDISINGSYYRVEANSFGIPQRNVFCDYCSKNGLTASWKTSNDLDLCNECYITLQDCQGGFQQFPMQPKSLSSDLMGLCLGHTNTSRQSTPIIREGIRQNGHTSIQHENVMKPMQFNLSEVRETSKIVQNSNSMVFDPKKINSKTINDPLMNEYIKNNVARPMQLYNKTNALLNPRTNVDDSYLDDSYLDGYDNYKMSKFECL